jgi:shikimate dehydrogenase
VNRSEGPAARAAALAGPAGRVAAAEELAGVDLIINATPLGMGVVVATDGTSEPLPVDVDRLGAGQVLVDLVYHPPITPLLAAARERGIRGVNGLGMLVNQAAHAFRRWTGEDPPLEAMSAAAVAGLAHRDADEFH